MKKPSPATSSAKPRRQVAASGAPAASGAQQATTGRQSAGLAEDTPIGLDQMLCFAVYKAEQAFNRVYRQALEPLGLTYPQFLTMRLLWNAGSLSVGQISEQLGLDSGTVTPLLKRLTLMGLVKKARRADDERRVDIFLTDEGRALEAKSDAVMRCIGEAVALDGREGGEMLTSINQLTANLARAARG